MRAQLADMFNHEFGNTDVGVRDAGGDVGKLFELRAGRPFREGEQVTIRFQHPLRFTHAFHRESG